MTHTTMSSRLAASLARRGLHYGWVVVGVTFLTMLVTAGTVGAPGVLIMCLLATALVLMLKRPGGDQASAPAAAPARQRIEGAP
jgi:hypothetical protein